MPPWCLKFKAEAGYRELLVPPRPTKAFLTTASTNHVATSSVEVVASANSMQTSCPSSQLSAFPREVY